jgi:hypothetical protein
MLVGLTKMIQYQTTIRHVATYWQQAIPPNAARWTWQKQPPAAKPVPVHPEFLANYLHLI